MRAKLLADVYATPHDDGPRVVLADVLLEAGDPRGELITLQLQRQRAERGNLKRERELLRDGGTAWHDGLDRERARVIAFARGFPVAAMAVNYTFAEPAWATIEALHLRGHLPFRGSPALRALRYLHDVTARALPGIVDGELELEVVSMIDRPPEAASLAPRVVVFQSHHRPPDAEVIASARAVAASPLGRRLRVMQYVHLESLDLAAAILDAAPGLDEVRYDTRRDPYGERTFTWSARIQRAALHVGWHGGAGVPGPSFDNLVATVKRLRAPAFESVVVAGKRGVPPLELARVRGLLRAVFETWPAVRDIQFLDA